MSDSMTPDVERQLLLAFSPIDKRALGLAFGTLCFSQTADISDQETTIRVDVRLVRILATVKDPAGNAIGTLGKEAFTVRDNGAVQATNIRKAMLNFMAVSGSRPPAPVRG